VCDGERRAHVLLRDEENEQFRRLRLAEIPSDGVRVLRILVKGIARLERVQLPTLHLHLDQAFEYVNEHVTRVTVCRVDVSRSELNRNQYTILARILGKRLPHQCRHLRTGVPSIRIDVAGEKESSD
jgi:hypothetical protein